GRQFTRSRPGRGAAGNHPGSVRPRRDRRREGQRGAGRDVGGCEELTRVQVREGVGVGPAASPGLPDGADALLRAPHVACSGQDERRQVRRCRSRDRGPETAVDIVGTCQGPAALHGGTVLGGQRGSRGRGLQEAHSGPCLQACRKGGRPVPGGGAGGARRREPDGRGGRGHIPSYCPALVRGALCRTPVGPRGGHRADREPLRPEARGWVRQPYCSGAEVV
ncbi:uncharacterized protein METZ01_LOCUS78770, partial [marine metagenome]